MIQPCLPIKSISNTFLGWVIPSWWPWLFLLSGLDVLWFTHLDQVHSQLNELAGAFIPGLPLPDKEENTLLPFALGGACLMLIAFALLSTRRAPPPETVVFADRLELFDGKATRIVYWKDVVIQDQGALDVWEETIGRGKGAYTVIRMDERQGQQRVPLRLYYHLNPAGRVAPRFRNTAALKRALLLALLHARPELRIDLMLYASCNVSPRTLEYSLQNTLMLWGAAAIGLLSFVASGYVYASYLNSPTLWNFLGGVVTGIASTSLALILLEKTVGQYFLIEPESPAVRAARRRLLGRDTPHSPQASALPMLGPKAADLPADIPQPSFRQQRYEKLVNSRAIPENYPWDELDGDDWYLILDKRPDFASVCRWQLLDGEAWAMLLSEHPEWAEHCDWTKLEPGDWADLIASAPQFDTICFQRIGWDDFDGTDWASLLASRPALLPHCNLALLDSEDWSYLLLFQPDLARHCPIKNLPK